MKIAILDDYQNVALTFADWARVQSKADITVFKDHLSEPDDVVTRLQPFEVLCVSRCAPEGAPGLSRSGCRASIDADGRGRISIEDAAALALLDEAELPRFVQRRFTIGYQRHAALGGSKPVAGLGHLRRWFW